MRRSSDRWLAVGVLLLAGLLTATAFLSYRSTRRVYADSRNVAHTHEVLDALNGLAADLNAADANRRAFIASGDERFLNARADAYAAAGRHLDAFAALTEDNPRQQARGVRLRGLTEARRATMDRAVAERKEPAFGELDADGLASLIAEAIAEERGLLADRERATVDAVAAGTAAGVTTALAGLLLVGVCVGLARARLMARERAAAEVLAQRELLHATLVSIGDGVIATDAAGNVTFLNIVAERLTAWTTADARGRPLEEVFRIVNEDTREPVENPARRALREGRVVGLANHTILIARDGTEWPLDDSAAPVRDAAGVATGAVLVFREITERKRAESDLRESEARFRGMADSIPQLAWMARADGHVFWYNQRWYDYTGTTLEQMQGWGWRAVQHPEVLPAVEERWAASLAAGEPFDMTFPLKGADGRFRPFLTRVYPLRDGRGRVTRWFGSNTDVSEQQATEAALREAGRLAALRADVAGALARGDAVRPALQGVAEALVARLDAAFARVWTVDESGTALELQASAGLYTRLDGGHARVPVGEFKIGRIAEGRRPHLTNDVAGDPHVGDREWARREGLVSFAGLPLLVEGRCVGVLAMFGRRPLAESVLAELTPLADAVAQWLARRASEGEVRAQSARMRRLADLAARLNTVLDVKSVLGLLAEEARGLIPSRRAAVHLLADPDGRPAERHSDSDHDPSEVPCAELAAPLTARDGRELGEIRLVGRPGARFTADDESVLGQLAQMASVALENARLVEELRDASTRKDEFLAMLAHELRNPLAPVRNSLALIRRPDAKGDAVARAHAMMGRQLEHLVRLVDDLLDVGRITKGKFELRRQRVELAAVVGAAVEACRPVIGSQDHELAVEVADEPVWLDADPVRLAQVFSNLLTNAAKYTERGGRIRLTAGPDGSDAVVAVADNGVGMVPELLPRVFDLFVQADRSLSRSQGGLGIGLTLVKRLTEMHGGTVSAASDGPGLGSTFAVRLPTAAAPARLPTPPEERAAGPLRRLRVLIVDDNRDAAASLAGLLAMDGDEVRTANDGLTGLALAGEYRPEVAVLDLGLPGLDGFELARRVRSEGWGGGVTLIALTGWGQEQDRRRSREAGFDHHLVKPVDLEELAALLDRVRAAGGA